MRGIGLFGRGRRIALVREGGRIGLCGVRGIGLPGRGCLAVRGWRGFAGGAEEEGVGPGEGHDDAGGGDGEERQAEPEAGDIVEVPLASAPVEAGSEED